MGVIGLEFNPEDKDLVEIVGCVGKAAVSFHTEEITKEEKEAEKTYIDSLIRTYIDLYRNDNNNEIPPKPLFGKAIDWYVDKTFVDYPSSLSKKILAIKGTMKKLVFKPLTQYKRELSNGSYGQEPNVALA